MKTLKWIIAILSISLLLASCIEYLEKTPEAEVTDEDIFGTFKSFQGFVEPMYEYVTDYSNQLITSMNIGGETLGTNYAGSARTAYEGRYMDWFTRANQQTLFNITGTTGIWTGGWKGIRIANLAIEKLPLLVDATQEEKDLIAGQAYFFRAWFHWEIIRSFGGMPYIDRVLNPNDDLDLPRLTYQETTDKIVEDFDKAAALLPEDWDKTTVGSAFQGANAGRATKGAALAFKAKALLYAGSPLMNKFSGKDYTYDGEYMKKAADAAWQVIELANKGVYNLLPFANYRDMFAKNDGTNPWSSETIFQKVKTEKGSNEMTGKHGRIYSPSRFGGNTSNECVNQLFVDKFEMADGTRYKTEYDSDNTKRWDFRDPRFRQNILVDRDKWGFAAATVLNFYVGTGSERTASNGFSSPYIVKKYWPIGVNSYDQQWLQYMYSNPHLRLAEIYLIYAEAVTEAYGASGKAPAANLTAVDAVNIVRNRAGMPNVTAAASGYESFQELIRNERNVELCFEGQYWFDSRRWYISHLDENKEFWDLTFDKAWTNFTRVKVTNRVFDNPKHYWMPLPTEQSQLFKGFYQNPGW